MSKWLMRDHFRHLHFNKFPMTWRKLQGKVLWPPAIELWIFGSPRGLPSPHFRSECCPHTLPKVGLWQAGKNIVEDFLIDGGENVNIVTKNFKTKLGLPKLKPTPYHLEIVDQSMIGPLWIIRNLKIHIHGIPYIATFIILKNSVVDYSYSMLFRRPWCKDAKVTHDWGINVIIVQGTRTIIIILINMKLGTKTRRPQVIIFYDLMEG